MLRHSPPWNAYAVSQNWQRSGQPVSRTNTVGKPTVSASPCSEWNISVIFSRAESFSIRHAFQAIGGQRRGLGSRITLLHVLERVACLGHLAERRLREADLHQ